MKIAAINGSPKGLKSNSNEIISILKGMISADARWQIVSQIRDINKLDDADFSADLYSSDVLIIAFPLYVDSLPASLMKFLEKYSKGYLESRVKGMPEQKRQRVFAVANCGFFEGLQNETALEMIEHLCRPAGLLWCGGAGIGTGEMILGIKNVPPEAGIKKPVTAALRKIAAAIEEKDGMLSENIYTQHKIPWLFYKIAGEFGWRQQIKKNRLLRKDIDARPLLE